jgi:hypothetical protein
MSEEQTKANKTQWHEYPVKPDKNTGKKVSIKWAKNNQKMDSEGEYLGTCDFITGHMPVMYIPKEDFVIAGCQCWWSFGEFKETPADHVEVIDGAIVRVYDDSKK